METSVIITFICGLIIGWIAWLIYNYNVFKLKDEADSNATYYFNRYKSVRDCLIDLINTINNKFPKSNLKYERTDNGDTISGEIKY